MTIASSVVSKPTATSADKLIIDFLYLDLTTCTRCRGTDRSLESALAAVGDVLRAAGVEVEVRKVHIRSEAEARAWRFVSSPTVRINGVDIAVELRESSCGSEACVDGCGDQIACRVWVFGGREYTEPPVELIVDAILRQVYGPAGDSVEDRPYELPDNLQRFFAGNSVGCGGDRGVGSGHPVCVLFTGGTGDVLCAGGQGWLLHRGGGLRMSLSPTVPDQPDAAVESVWRDLHDPLLRFISRRVPDRASAEDILQEVMLRLHRHADEIRQVDSVSGWIHTISRNAITDYYRAAARREAAGRQPDPERRARRSRRRARTGAAPGGAHRLSGAAAGPAVTGAPGGAAAHRPRRPDPGRGRCPARPVDVGHEVAGAAGPQPAAGPVQRLLRHPPRPPRWRDRLPAPRWRRLLLQHCTVGGNAAVRRVGGRR